MKGELQEIGADRDDIAFLQDGSRALGAVDDQRGELALSLDLDVFADLAEKRVLARDRAVVQPDHAALGATGDRIALDQHEPRGLAPSEDGQDRSRAHIRCPLRAPSAPLPSWPARRAPGRNSADGGLAVQEPEHGLEMRRARP